MKTRTTGQDTTRKTGVALKKKPGKGRPTGNPTGRPEGAREKFTPAIVDEICKRLAGGESLNQICRTPHLPCRDTVYAWMLDASEKGAPKELIAFSDKYTRARQMQADSMIDDCLEIADDSSRDAVTIEKADGSTYEKVNQEVVSRSKLRVETRIKLAEKMAPRKYGRQAIDVDITSDGDSLVAILEAGNRRVEVLR